jgi:hypothetical protein
MHFVARTDLLHMQPRAESFQIILVVRAIQRAHYIGPRKRDGSFCTRPMRGYGDREAHGIQCPAAEGGAFEEQSLDCLTSHRLADAIVNK